MVSRGRLNYKTMFIPIRLYFAGHTIAFRAEAWLDPTEVPGWQAEAMETNQTSNKQPLGHDAQLTGQLCKQDDL